MLNLAEPAPPLPYVEIDNPIARLGVIGDGRTVAVVREDGSIPLLCWPRIDSPSVFSAMLGGDPAAHAAFHLDAMAPSGQRYLHDTNVLETSLDGAEGSVALTDCMAWPEGADGPQLIVRRVTATRGMPRITFAAGPRPDYERAAPNLSRIDAHTWRVANADFAIAASFPLDVENDVVTGGTLLSEGESAWVVLFDPRTAFVRERFDPNAVIEESAAYWRSRIAPLSYTGPHRDRVARSMLALWLCENRETSALTAAGTFAFPEAPGGKRNWDYRYTWVRDTCFGARAAARAGFTEDAARWLRFVVLENETCARSPLRLMQTVDGKPVEGESSLDRFDGLMEAQPVLVGNDAAEQLQLDIFGEIMLAAKALADRGCAPQKDFLERLRSLLTWLAGHWDAPDASIWEIRGQQKRYLFSALMSWLAFAHATDLFEKAGQSPDPRWPGLADEIAATIRADYWCPATESYMQTSECSMVDAAAIMMRLCGFLEPDDPRWKATEESVRSALLKRTGILRYPHAAHDGFDSDEGTFILCTGWWIQALHLDGRRDEARAVLDTVLEKLGPTDLAPEQLDEDGMALGNIPQVFSHAAIIEAVLTLHGEE